MLAPYATVAGSTAGLNTKLNISDTASMLSSYARTQRMIDSLSLVQSRINLKLNIADTAAMLAPYANASTVNNSIATKLNIADTAAMLSPYIKQADLGNFVDLTTTQTIVGAKTFSSDITVNGIKIGRSAGGKSTNTAIGASVLNSNTSGNFNTAIGVSALSTNTTGNYNTALGYGADVNSENLANATALGYGAIADSSNTIRLGNASVKAVNTSGNINAKSFIKSGGTSSQYLMADGSVSSGPAAINDATDEFTATASQTSFTLTQIPSTHSKVKMYINGIRISNLAYSWTAKTLTYVPANNGSYTLTAGDRIQFDYFY
jgi:hypothetical protein